MSPICFHEVLIDNSITLISPIYASLGILFLPPPRMESTRYIGILEEKILGRKRLDLFPPFDVGG